MDGSKKKTGAIFSKKKKPSRTVWARRLAIYPIVMESHHKNIICLKEEKKNGTIERTKRGEFKYKIGNVLFARFPAVFSEAAAEIIFVHQSRRCAVAARVHCGRVLIFVWRTLVMRQSLNSRSTSTTRYRIDCFSPYTWHVRNEMNMTWLSFYVWK